MALRNGGQSGSTKLYGYVRRVGTTQGLAGIVVAATTLDGHLHDTTSSRQDGYYAIRFPRNSGEWWLKFKDPDGIYAPFETKALILDYDEQQQNVVLLSPREDAGQAGRTASPTPQGTAQ